jgi:hypothetical protein
VVSTYSIATFGLSGGVLSSNGDIHFIPWTAGVGQKVSVSGVVSTYSLISTTTSGAYGNGVLAPNGDIHFVPWKAGVGQRVSSSGVVSTYSLIYTNSSGAHFGGILTPDGNITFFPYFAPVIQEISTTSSLPFDIGTCCSSFLNKY